MIKIFLLIIIAITNGIPPAQAEFKDTEWTILVYHNGKNDLEKYMRKQITQLEKLGSTQRIRWIVEWGELSTKHVYRLEVKKNSNHEASLIYSPILQDLGDKVDMGDANHLVDFVTWGVNTFPSQKLLLMVNDHGNVWEGSHEGIISYDDQYDSSMNPHEFTAALHRIKNKIGKKIDVLLLDACLMSSIEVMGQAYGAVEYYVGSKELEELNGINFLALQSLINTAPHLDSRAMVAAIINAGYRSQPYKIFLSGVDLKYMPELARVSKNLFSKLISLSDEEFDQVRNKILKTLENPNNRLETSVSLIPLIAAIQSAQVQNLEQELIEFAEVFKQFYFQVKTGMRTGISIWFPINKSEVQDLASQYRHLRFERATSWLSVLKRIFDID